MGIIQCLLKFSHLYGSLFIHLMWKFWGRHYVKTGCACDTGIPHRSASSRPGSSASFLWTSKGNQSTWPPAIKVRKWEGVPSSWLDSAHFWLFKSLKNRPMNYCVCEYIFLSLYCSTFQIDESFEREKGVCKYVHTYYIYWIPVLYHSPFWILHSIISSL